jgi:hypothetical protein
MKLRVFAGRRAKSPIQLRKTVAGVKGRVGSADPPPVRRKVYRTTDGINRRVKPNHCRLETLVLDDMALLPSLLVYEQ